MSAPGEERGAVDTVREVFEALFFFRSDRTSDLTRRGNALRVLLLAVLVVSVSLIVVDVRPSPAGIEPAQNYHARESLEYSTYRQLCGGYNLDSVNSVHLTEYIRSNPGFENEPLLDIAVRQFGSVEGFCDVHLHSRSYHDPALSWLTNGLFVLDPAMSLVDYGIYLYWTKILVLFFAVAFLLALRIPVFHCAVIAASSLMVIEGYYGRFFFDAYAFTPVFTLLLIGSLACGGFGLVRLRWESRDWMSLAGLFAVYGVVLCLAANFRTSLFAVGFLALVFVLVTAGLRSYLLDKSSWRSFLARTALAVALLFVGFQITSISLNNLYRHAPSDVSQSYPASHTVAHMFVMGLGTGVDSDLADRERLDHTDTAVFAKATSLAPNVPALTLEYERLLWAYYVGLVIRFPGEVADIYYQKFAVSSDIIVDEFCGKRFGGSGADSRLCDAKSSIIDDDGLAFPLIFLAVFLISAIVYLRTGAGQALVYSIIALTSCLFFIEMILTLTVYKEQSFVLILFVLMLVTVPIGVVQLAYDRYSRRTPPVIEGDPAG